MYRLAKELEQISPNNVRGRSVIQVRYFHISLFPRQSCMKDKFFMSQYIHHRTRVEYEEQKVPT